MKNYHTQIQKMLNQIEVLNKKCRKLSLEKSRYRMKLKKEKAKEKRNKYKQTRKEINNLTLRIGNLYEEKAISIESDEEKLPLLLKALEYYEKSSYYESLRVLKTIKNISSSIRNNKLVKLCDTKKLYIEAEMLNNNAELLWYTCLRLAEKGQMDEKDERWAKLNLLRGKIIRKLNKGLKYTIELDNPYLEIDFLTSLTWNLYRRLNRHKFRKKINNYHKRAAQIYESIAMKNINSNPELSIENFKKAIGQYWQGELSNDKKRLCKIICDNFEDKLSKKELYSIKWSSSETSNDFKKLAEEIILEEKYVSSNFLRIKAMQFSLKARENPEDLDSYFTASKYYEKLHRKLYKNIKTGLHLGNSYFFKGLGYSRLATSSGLFSIAGKEYLKKSIENIQKSINISDWAFKEPIYLSIYKTIFEVINLPSKEINKSKIFERLKITKFLIWQYNELSEKNLIKNLELLITAIYEKNNLSAIDYLKKIDIELSKIKSETKELVRQVIPTIGWEKVKSIEIKELIKIKLDKSELIKKWKDCLIEKNRQLKGKLLEDFVIILFKTIENFFVFDKNLNTANEELDIVFINNIEKPFWISLNSPHVFFECKNWSSKVKVSDIRDFETKLINHSNLVRIGIFVAVKGYESGCFIEQIRAGRGNNIIILVSGNDINKFFESSLDTIEWLERLISSCIK